MAVKCILTGQTPSVLDGVTENVQTQLNDKVDKVTGKGLSTNDYTDAEKTKLSGIETGAQKNTITGVKGNAETTYRTGNVNITATNIGLGNVNNTSDANKPISNATQTALNNKQSKITANGVLKGDGSGNISAATAADIPGLSGKQATITGAATTITANNLTANRALISNSSGKVEVSSVTSTELGYLDGVTSNIQTQLNNKLSSAPVTSVAGKTGAVTLAKGDVGLGNVDNTSDANKPISTATQAALHDKQSKITANGILKGDGSGNITAANETEVELVSLPNICNPNLLDNWYFGNPVNQRGQTSYTGAGYGIDRWKIQNDTNLTVGDGFCTLNGSWDIRQMLENLPKATYTASILFKNSTASALQIMFGRKGGDVSVAISHDASGLLAGTISNSDFSNIIISLSGSGSVDIIAIKLELGSQQTLAHQENGKWVLNEIPDYGEQLRRCQRYFWRFSLPKQVGGAVAFGMNINFARALIILPTTMRAVPTCSISPGMYLSGTTGDVRDPSPSVIWATTNTVFVEFAKADSFKGNSVYFVRGGDTGSIDVSADL